MAKCYLRANNIKTIDYKDTETLSQFVNTHARIMNRRNTGACAKHQRQLTRAIKRARFMGLLPYISR